MKIKLLIKFCSLIAFFLLESNWIKKSVQSDYIIQKKNGQIILAYKAFEDFLNSDKSWESYKSILLDPFPSVQKVHNRMIEWGSIDTVKFPKEVESFKKDDFEKFMTQYDLKTINNLYDSVIEKANKVLPLVSHKKVDLCFYLPYGGCFVLPEDNLNTICVSMYIDPSEVEKIMAHEYSHILHIDRKPKETLTLRGEVVSEGMAVYLTNRIIKIDVSNSVPFMPKSSFEWCMNNEQQIKDSIKLELNDTTQRLYKRYISDGAGFSAPPKGFVEKTAYFIGYRIIEKCINKGMTIEEICSLGSEAVIEKSGYFKNK